jgi:hypothetical protein
VQDRGALVPTGLEVVEGHETDSREAEASRDQRRDDVVWIVERAGGRGMSGGSVHASTEQIAAETRGYGSLLSERMVLCNTSSGCEVAVRVGRVANVSGRRRMRVGLGLALALSPDRCSELWLDLTCSQAAQHHLHHNLRILRYPLPCRPHLFPHTIPPTCRMYTPCRTTR